MLFMCGMKGDCAVEHDTQTLNLKGGRDGGVVHGKCETVGSGADELHELI